MKHLSKGIRENILAARALSGRTALPPSRRWSAPRELPQPDAAEPEAAKPQKRSESPLTGEPYSRREAIRDLDGVLRREARRYGGDLGI